MELSVSINDLLFSELQEYIRDFESLDEMVEVALESFIYPDFRAVEEMRFSSELNAICMSAVDQAYEIWGEARPRLDGLKIVAANFAGYGRYSAYYAPHLKTISIPTNNSFSLLRQTTDGLEIVSGKRKQFEGTLLHEIAHGVVSTAQEQPWDCPELETKLVSTHLCPSWVWICAKGWQSQGFDIDAVDMAETLRYLKSHSEPLRYAMPRFSPFVAPPELPLALLDARRNRQCLECGAKPVAKKYCSTVCRVKAHRKKQKVT